MSERCICCGETIPEGRQVCPVCETSTIQKYKPEEKKIEEAHKHSRKGKEDKKRRHVEKKIIEAITIIESDPKKHLTDYRICEALYQARDFLMSDCKRKARGEKKEDGHICHG